MQNKIISFNRKISNREKTEFICSGVRYHYGDKYMKYPIIRLRDKETKTILWDTHYERYICDLREAMLLEWQTLKRKAAAVCLFLNYLLHETTVERVNECSIQDIHDFFEYAKVKDDGETYQSSTWIKYKQSVIDFLENYHRENKDKVHFNYEGDKLSKYIIVEKQGSERTYIIKQTQGLSVKCPEEKEVKNRYLRRSYLDLLIFEARKYDSELVLAIMFQAYAGLREGEVVNLAFGEGSIKFNNRGFGRLDKIIIFMSDEAEHMKQLDLETEPGKIKKHKNREVFDDFLEIVKKQYEYHRAIKASKGISIENGSPLFTNLWNHPMTVTTYRNRLKKLFYGHFLPDLKKSCELQGTWAENAPYIEQYEVEYPGAHALRHWFTMYLLEVGKGPNGKPLSESEIANLRGDKSVTSIKDYIHSHKGILKEYTESVFVLQEWILEEGKNNYEQWKAKRAESISKIGDQETNS